MVLHSFTHTHVPIYSAIIFYFLSTVHGIASVAASGRDEMNEKVLWDVMWEFDTRIG